MLTRWSLSLSIHLWISLSSPKTLMSLRFVFWRQIVQDEEHSTLMRLRGGSREPLTPAGTGGLEGRARAMPERGISPHPHPARGQARRTGDGRSDWGMSSPGRTGQEGDQSKDGDKPSAGFFPWAAGEGGHAKGTGLGKD